jgi:[protein-PII] uridylyltransferase
MARKRKLKMTERQMGTQSGLDEQALRQHLSDVAKEGGSHKRSRILEALRQTLTTAMAQTEELFSMGRLGGLETAARIAAIHDVIITTLFDYTTSHEIRASNPTEAERFALCGVGGYGRAEMAPQSDVDLLFLISEKKGSAYTEQVTEYMLYMLWDLGLKVGHATRTIEQCLSLAKEDQTILTALLDLRFLRGDRLLADQLYSQFRKDVTRGKGRKYIAKKLEERDIRHAREGNSRYVIEPNIKEGKGGLRDLHVLYWIARFLDNESKITDPHLTDRYVELDLFDAAAATRFKHAADFLWRARIWLHLTAKRPTETLSFDHQTVLARKMGYASGPVEVAVEKFMREYFTNAKEVGALTRIACAKLEAQKAIRLPAGLEALLPGSRRNLKNKALKMEHGRLNFADPLQIRHDPSIIMQLFETAGRRNVDIHPDAFSAISFRRNIIDNDFRRNPANSTLFQKILLGAKAPAATLKAMNESDVLGRYLLEFGGIVARTQFNMHHAYTVDEHTLRLVANFNDLEKGRLEDENPIITQIAQDFSQEERLILYLACLLHDTGKGQGDQCIEGAQLGRRACRRLGVSKTITDTVAWLIRRHLDMSETAQRRDISDPDTIAEFGQLVGSVEQLNLLFALTVVDIRSVGPGIWNDWKGVLLRNLYQATANYLDGKESLAPAAKAGAAREQLIEKLPGDMAQRIDPLLQDMSQNYWLNFDMTDMLRHTRFFDQVIQDGVETAVQTRLTRNRDITELWILTRDRQGLFAELTKAISSTGASITGAKLHTSDTGRVMNVFYLQNAEGLAFGRQSNHALEVLRKRAQIAAEGQDIEVSIPAPLKSRRAGAIPVKPRIRFLQNKSGGATILEIEGRDRPGLLHDIASILRDCDVQVLSAHIEVAGITAIDSFYLCRPDFSVKDEDYALSQSLKKSIRQKLTELLTPQNSHAA